MCIGGKVHLLCMNASAQARLESFQMAVGTKFQLYNSLFISLPFHRIEKTGILLSLFLTHCEEGSRKGLSPVEIVDSFFKKYTYAQTAQEQRDYLFRFIQYAERQVVLFDAVEDAAFETITDVAGSGTMKHLAARVSAEEKESALLHKLQSFSVMPVLTAHPTQFYPGPVLGIINDLSVALKENNAVRINTLLQQLGKTPLLNKQRPTPYDEAISLVWYLEHIFYHAVGNLLADLRSFFPQLQFHKNPVIRMGFWPGGDRDGNPNVTAETTLQVAGALRATIIRCYYYEVRRLKRRLTFRGVDVVLAGLETKLYRQNYLQPQEALLAPQDVLLPLMQIRELLVYEHGSLFLAEVESLINKVHAFGLHFATLDIRQESGVHAAVLAEASAFVPALNGYESLHDEEKMAAIRGINTIVEADRFERLGRDALLSVDAIAAIQKNNGERGCHRYIISQCGSALNVLEVYALFLLRGWKQEDIHVDIVPLFETVDDLRSAPAVMTALYANASYAQHLKHRGMKQTIMVGFSDGTKDGGYLMANWSIYKAKAELTRISREHGVSVLFFDGRGGPPARGGGKTHKFYASIGRNISTDEIQLTIQGQTVSSNFGTTASAQYNIEQLLHAGIVNDIFSEGEEGLQSEQSEAVEALATASYKAYKALKEHPDFMDYLTDVSPLKYYSDTNISSRPAKRGVARRLTLKDLRAIPFVGAWSQIKQNVPGYYGLGTALEQASAEGRFEAIKQLYLRSAYFRTLIDNCEMAMKKCDFSLTAYLSNHPKYGALWTMVAEEYERTSRWLKQLTGKNELMENYPVERLSIHMRERIVLPLTTIQQYALAQLREQEVLADAEKEALEKLVIRTSFGIINAGRNSV